MRGPGEAAKRIDSYVDLEMSPRKIFDVLVEIIKAEDWLNDGETADELASIWATKFHSQLKRRAAKEELSSRVSCFEFNTKNDQYIQGSCFVEPIATQEERVAKVRRANCSHIAVELRTVSDRGFEILCSNVLSLMGVEEARCTRFSVDHGIDFFGRLRIGDMLMSQAIAPGAEKQIVVWLVGQAKNYTASKVATRDIRELMGAAVLVRSRGDLNRDDPGQAPRIRMCDPVVSLFFTTGGISRDASELAKSTGVVLMDGDQLAVFLADNGVGIVDGRFEKETFRAWARGGEIDNSL